MLRRALLISLLFHGLLLFPEFVPRQDLAKESGEGEAGRLTAMLTSQRAPAPDAAPPRAVDTIRHVRSAASREASSSRPVLLQAAGPLVVHGQPAAGGTGQDGVAKAAEAAVGSTLPPTAVAAASGGVANDDDLRQYALALAREARRFKRYPPLARERGWEGVVRIAIRLTADGRPEISLAQGSSFEILDLQAQEMIEKASRVARVPEGLQGRSLTFVLPIRYSLDD